MTRVVATIGAVCVLSVMVAAQQAGGGRTGGARAAAPAGPKVVASVRDIMGGLVMPTSDIVFAFGGEEPKNDADWEKLRVNALMLAESANLLTMGTRARDRADWVKMARAQLDAAEAVVKLATAKKVDGLSEASDTLYETCPTCHNKYWADRNQPK